MAAFTPSLRLIADDLTGALDAAAEFGPLTGPVLVSWGGVGRRARALAVDSATREIDARRAARKTRRLAAEIGLPKAEIAYFKVDSLLRGHAGHELAAILAGTDFDAIVIAPAFPFQKRQTVGGRQQMRNSHGWETTGEDIAATLSTFGHVVRISGPGTPVKTGISIFDATTDNDLAAIVESGLGFPGRMLWCGSAGLARALARQTTCVEPSLPELATPLLALFGTDHPVTSAQIARVERYCLTVDGGGLAEADRLERALGGGPVVARFAVPAGSSRAAAAEYIRATLESLLPGLAPPGTLIAGGGETLRVVCDVLGAEALLITGSLTPGVPRSRLVGGGWDGVEIISKSGAFGDPDFLTRLFDAVAIGVSGRFEGQNKREMTA